jgi:hypothetical protein
VRRRFPGLEIVVTSRDTGNWASTQLADIRRDIERCATERERDHAGLAAYLGSLVRND